MPKELRKRGKKFKKPALDAEALPEPIIVDEEPDVVVEETVTADLPFGELSNDVKAYFRSADLQLRDWEGEASEKQMLYRATLNELRGNEAQLATDPECSVILERMIWDMDGFVQRVFLDSLCGSKETVHRESQTQVSTSTDGLRTMTQLVEDVADEVISHDLISNQYGAHVLNSLLSLLSGHEATNFNGTLNVYSSPIPHIQITVDFGSSDVFVHNSTSSQNTLYDVLSLSNEPKEVQKDHIITLSRDTTGSRIVECLFTVSPSQKHFDALWNAIFGQSQPYASTSNVTTSSTWNTRLSPLYRCLLHPAANHILFSAIQHPSLFAKRETHLKDVMTECEGVWRKIVLEDGRWGLIVALANRIGLARAKQIDESELGEQLLEALYETFGLSQVDEDERERLLIQCVLKMVRFEELNGPDAEESAPPQTEVHTEETPWSSNHNKKKKKHDRKPQRGSFAQPSTNSSQSNSLQKEYTVPGVTLLQALLKAIFSFSQLRLIKTPDDVIVDMTWNEKASRVFDIIFIPKNDSSPSPSSAISTSALRTLTLRLAPLLPRIVDNKYGSFVGERIWKWGDGYLKVKFVLCYEKILAVKADGFWKGKTTSGFDTELQAI
ncbi:hypothetical protein DL96DRAFT_1706610 [Flagelloscypha sp. PMI_526]|nr:hypothetical protein DL96DRAFT_1706610 [Flagelloscypha sp. PMI_526]